MFDAIQGLENKMIASGRPTGHVGYLDGWRGLAICTLLVGHFFPMPGINFGAVGVSLFFVLSGLLMGGLLFEKQELLATFYRRRFARIVPAHLVFIAIVAVACFVDDRFSVRECLSALFFLNNYVGPEGGPGQAEMPFGHVWSLSVEEHSYVVLSLVAVAARKRLFRAAAAVLALVVCVMGCALFYQWLNPPTLAFTLWLHTEVAAYGLLAAALWVAADRPWPRKLNGPWFAPALVLIGIGLQWWSIPPVVQRLVGVGCFVLAICSLHACKGWFIAVLSWAPLRQMGAWSFSIYLWQQPFYLMAHRGEIKSSAAALAISLAFGLASYYLIERPARAFLNANWGTKAAAPRLTVA